MESILNEIPVFVNGRQWMKSGRCWRLSLRLPTEPLALAPALSGMIGTQVRACIRGAMDVDIDPALIVDVPAKSRQFFLELENVYEKQNGIGPTLTAMVNQGCVLTLLPVGEDKAEVVVTGDVRVDTLKGLHVAFFQNPLFWDFIRRRALDAGERIQVDSSEQCKAAFKQLAGVETCRALSEQYVRETIRDFNQFINGGR